MHKTKRAIALLALLAIASCKKEKQPNSPSDNYWTVDDHRYGTVAWSAPGNGFVFTNGTRSSVNFVFSSLPESSGTYKVSADAHPGAGEVQVITAEGFPAIIGTANRGTVAIEISGKIATLKCANITLARVDSTGTFIDSAIFNASLTYVGL